MAHTTLPVVNPLHGNAYDERVKSFSCAARSHDQLHYALRDDDCIMCSISCVIFVTNDEIIASRDDSHQSDAMNLFVLCSDVSSTTIRSRFPFE